VTRFLRITAVKWPQTPSSRSQMKHSPPYSRHRRGRSQQQETVSQRVDAAFIFA
jgi:hypothetical protein